MIALSVDEAIVILTPLAKYLAGIVIYALFIYKFYRFLSKKDIFKLDLNQYNPGEHPTIKRFFRVLFYLVEYICIFPLFVFFWFGILVTLLTFLSKSQPLSNILLMAMAIVGAVRAAAYFTEDLSKDLAKMLPFTLLGIFIVDVSYFSLEGSLALLKTIPDHWHTLVYYLLFIVCLEFFFRVSRAFFFTFFVKDEEDYA